MIQKECSQDTAKGGLESLTLYLMSSERGTTLMFESGSVEGGGLKVSFLVMFWAFVKNTFEASLYCRESAVSMVSLLKSGSD